MHFLTDILEKQVATPAFFMPLVAEIFLSCYNYPINRKEADDHEAI